MCIAGHVKYGQDATAGGQVAAASVHRGAGDDAGRHAQDQIAGRRAPVPIAEVATDELVPRGDLAPLLLRVGIAEADGGRQGVRDLNRGWVARIPEEVVCVCVCVCVRACVCVRVCAHICVVCV